MAQTPNTTPSGLNQWNPEDPLNTAQLTADNAIIDAALAGKANMSSGIWTPTVTNATLSNITFATWRKNGTHVQATFYGYLQKGSNASDVITFGGLPFAAIQTGVCHITSNIYFVSNAMPITGHVSGTTAQLWVWGLSSGVSGYLRNSSIASTEPIGMRLVCDYEASI